MIDSSIDLSQLMFDILFDLVSKRSVLPRCLVLSNVTIKGDITSPATGGGYADVWEGSLDGSSVALKVLREFNNPAALRKVRMSSHYFI